MCILVVEDDEDITTVLKRGFELEGYSVDCADTGEAAIERIQAKHYDSIILDVMLPGCSGIDVCKAIRNVREDATIIMLSARDTVPDRIEGLKAGADDYMIKPFSFDELLARVRAQERRHKSTTRTLEDGKLAIGDLVYDQLMRKLDRGEKSVVLTDKEADLLLLFANNAQKPLSRNDIFAALWAEQGGNALNVVDVYVGYLRRKLSTLDLDPKLFIKTVRGVGFVLDPT